jgi:hypothetical protein
MGKEGSSVQQIISKINQQRPTPLETQNICHTHIYTKLKEKL